METPFTPFSRLGAIKGDTKRRPRSKTLNFSSKQVWIVGSHEQKKRKKKELRGENLLIEL